MVAVLPVLLIRYAVKFEGDSQSTLHFFALSVLVCVWRDVRVEIQVLFCMRTIAITVPRTYSFVCV